MQNIVAGGFCEPNVGLIGAIIIQIVVTEGESGAGAERVFGVFLREARKRLVIGRRGMIVKRVRERVQLLAGINGSGRGGWQRRRGRRR